MKKWLLIVFCMVAVASYGQIPTGLPTQFSNQWYRFSRYMTVDSLFGLPYRDTNFVAFRAGVLVTRPADSLVYRSTGKTSGKKWDLAGTGGTFGVYTAGNGLALSGTTFRVDTSVIAARARLQKVADSLGAIISGTVPTSTSVSTSYGLEGGGTLTTSLSLEADTLQLSTRAWRKKGTDSVAALLSNYTPTSRNITTGFGLTGGGNLTTDRTLVTDTTNSLASKLRLYKVADSLGGVIASVTADSLIFSTRAWRQKGLDSIKFAANTWSAKQTFTDSILGANQKLTGNLLVSSNNTTGGGILIADDGGIFDYNTGFIGIASDYGVHIFSSKISSTPVITMTNGGAISANSSVTANSFIKSGGTSSQALLADGSVLSNPVNGTGTANTISMFTASGTVGNSALTQTSTTLSVPRQLNITLPTDTSIVGTLVGTGVNVGSQWVFKNDYNTRGGFVGIAAGETTGDMVLAVGDNKKIVFGLGTGGNSRGAEFSENAFKIFQTAGSTSNWVTLGSLTGTQTWLFGSATTGSGFTLKTDAYINVTINGTAYKLALVN